MALKRWATELQAPVKSAATTEVITIVQLCSTVDVAKSSERYVETRRGTLPFSFSRIFEIHPSHSYSYSAFFKLLQTASILNVAYWPIAIHSS